jgi:ParB family chromosome partitioning protein
MEIKKLSITALKPAEYNPRVMSKEEFNGLVASIKTFGLVDPIIINKDFTIIGGHRRYDACKKLKYKEVDCIILDLDKHEEKKLNVILNSQAISGKYDDNLLSELLEELKLDDDYEELRLDQLQPLDLTDKLPDDLDEDNINKPPKLTISFQTVEDLENAKVEIEEILSKYDKAYLSVSAGEL